MTASTGVSQRRVRVFQVQAPPSCWVTAGCPLVVMRTRMSPDASGRPSHWALVVAAVCGDGVGEGGRSTVVDRVTWAGPPQAASTHGAAVTVTPSGIQVRKLTPG